MVSLYTVLNYAYMLFVRVFSQYLPLQNFVFSMTTCCLHQFCLDVKLTYIYKKVVVCISSVQMLDSQTSTRKLLSVSVLSRCYTHIHLQESCCLYQFCLDVKLTYIYKNVVVYIISVQMFSSHASTRQFLSVSVLSRC